MKNNLLIMQKRRQETNFPPPYSCFVYLSERLDILDEGFAVPASVFGKADLHLRSLLETILGQISSQRRGARPVLQQYIPRGREHFPLPIPGKE